MLPDRVCKRCGAWLPASAGRVCDDGCRRPLADDPSEEQIKALTAKIRRRWSDEMHQKRAGHPISAGGAEIPFIPITDLIGGQKNFKDESWT